MILLIIQLSYIQKIYQKKINEDPYAPRRKRDFLATQKNIEDSYVMSDWRGYSYYANSKLLFATFGEGVKGDDLNKFVSRENWSPFEIWYSNANNYPVDRHDKK